MVACLGHELVVSPGVIPLGLHYSAEAKRQHPAGATQIIEKVGSPSLALRTTAKATSSGTEKPGMRRRLGPNDKGSAAWKELRLSILARDKRMCYSPYPDVCTGQATEVDHLIPRSQGGRSVAYNLRAICRSCNNEKSKSERRGIY